MATSQPPSAAPCAARPVPAASTAASTAQGVAGGVDLRSIPMQQVELQPCNPAVQECKELEWVFRVAKPQVAPVIPDQKLKEAASVHNGGGVWSWLGLGGGTTADGSTQASLQQNGALDPESSESTESAGRQPHRAPECDTELGSTLSKALFVWLGLPHDAFFVNLKPNEPHRVLHPTISSTEEADFFLKNTTSFLLHPDTPSGRKFWNAVYEPPPASTCVSFRQWIVPQPSTVIETDEYIYVVEAPLGVQEEAEYVSWTGDAAAAVANACDAEQDPRILAIGNQVFREEVLPRVQRAVNEGPAFEELRVIYYWRVIAEWFDRQHPGFYANIQAMDFTAWSVEAGMAYANKVWKIYADSNLHGLFNTRKRIRHQNQLFNRLYSHGAVHIEHVPIAVLGHMRSVASEPPSQRFV